MINDTQSDRLTRSRFGWLAGVCEGLGRRFGINPIWIRLAWLAAFFLAGSGLLLYLLLWWIIPSDDALPYEPSVWIRESGGSHPPLQRTVSDRKLLGVCGGMARRWDIDPSLVRLLCVAAFAASGGMAVIVYLGAAIFIPTTAVERAVAHPVEF